MRSPLRAAALAAALALLSTASLYAAERSFDGGAHLWFGSGWGEFRAYAGPRWHWGGFTLYPHGALGMAFFSNTSGTPLTLGVYGDADYLFDLGEHKGIRLGAGGGPGSIVGIQGMTGWVIPQGYAQAGYRWGVNFVGVQAIVGPAYDKPAGFPAAFPAKLDFTGVGLRFEYEIDPPKND